MLVQLQIQDLAIIDKVVVELGPGLTVLTGETGAGKSIIVGAASLLRGDRGSTVAVRTGCDKAVVEAIFDLSRDPEILEEVEAAGLPVEGEELLVRRTLARSGRGRVHVNGALCTAAVLRRITHRMVEIAGQHEYQILSDRSTHCAILDSFGVEPSLLGTLREAHAELKHAWERMEHCQIDGQARSGRVAFLRFQLEELERLAIRPGEAEDLEQERRRLARAGDLLEAAGRGERELYSSDGSVVERVATTRQRIEELVAVDPRLAPVLGQLDEAQVLVEDAALTLGRYAAGIETDPARLLQVEERLDLVLRLARKHGCAPSELLQRQRAISLELADLEHAEQTIEVLQAQVDQIRRGAEELAGRASRARRRAAHRLVGAVNGALERLGMQDARLSVSVTARRRREGEPAAFCFGDRRLAAGGWDQVEFMITTNPGEDARPLQQVASGGELSRVMLALRTGLGDHHPVGTTIYDEVDAGIGGAVADRVGRTLSEVARHRQVLCVTHLPQVAAHADHHLRVGKASVGGRKVTKVQRLDDEARVEELARMLGGKRVTRQARANARQLLEAARTA